MIDQINLGRGRTFRISRILPLSWPLDWVLMRSMSRKIGFISRLRSLRRREWCALVFPETSREQSLLPCGIGCILIGVTT